MRGEIHSLVWRLLVFLASMLFCCGIAAIAAMRLVGFRAVEGVVCAGVLCVLPGSLTVIASNFFRRGRFSVYLVLFAMVNRLLFVLVGVLSLGVIRADLGFFEFMVWLIPIYLVALALETWLVLLPFESSSV